jgi:hypothetical protein
MRLKDHLTPRYSTPGTQRCLLKELGIASIIQTHCFLPGEHCSTRELQCLLNASRSDHSAAQVILQRFQEARTKYADSLSYSIQAAKPSQEFANRAQNLCAALAEGQETCSDEFIHNSIAEMRKISQESHATAKATLDMLSGNRQELTEVRRSYTDESS